MALVAYTDPQGVFGQQEALVVEKLGVLKNLHWRPLSSDWEESNAGPKLLLNQTIRTIPQLDLRLGPEISDKAQQHQILGLNHAPLVQILVVGTCSLEIYREKLRQIGKNWLANHVNRRDSTGYVVVHATNSQNSAKLTKSIHNRLVNEFGSTNCVQLDMSTESGRPTPLNTIIGNEQLTGWSSLRHLVTEQLLMAFGQRVEQLHEEINKLRANQDIPGWNVGQYFAVHISLASAYAALGLLDDALQVYQHLEKLVAKQPKETWKNPPELALDAESLGFGHIVSADQALKSRDTIVDLVLGQQSSLFDVQQYLLAKQIDLRLGMAESQAISSNSLADQLAREAVWLVIAKLPLLQNLLVTTVGSVKGLGWLLIMLQRFIDRVIVFKSERLAAALADLVLIERDYWQQLGALVDYKIVGVFNDVSLEEEEDSTEPLADVKKIPGMQSLTAFEQQFFALTKTAIDFYKTAGMSRAVLRLMAQTLLVHYHQKQWEKCWEIYDQYPMLLQSPSVSALALFEAVLASARQTNRSNESQKLAWRILHRTDAPLSLVRSAVHEIENFTSTNEWEAKWPLSTWFTTKLAPYLRADENGYYLDLELQPQRSTYPFVKFTSIRLKTEFIDPITKSTTQVWFHSADSGNESNKDTDQLRYKLYTHRFVQGIWAVCELEVAHSSAVKFNHVFEDTWVAMKPLSTSFTAGLALASDHSMRKRNVVLTINSPTVVKQAKVRLLPVDQHLQLQTEKTSKADAASLSNFTAHTITVPALINFETPISRAKVCIEYDLGKGEPFYYEFIKTLDFSLEVSVDFQESFRKPPVILTQFLVKPFNQIPIRFLHSNLESSTEYLASRLLSDHYEREMTGFSQAPVSYVFSIAKRETPTTKAPLLMQYELRYRSLLTECQHILYQRCLAYLDEAMLSYQLVLQSVIDQLGKNIDFAEYVCTNRIVLVTSDAIATAIKTVMEFMDPEDAKKLSQILELATESTQVLSSDELAALDSRMQLDVPNPDADVVHYLSLQIATDHTNNQKLTYIIGEPITVRLEIDTITFRSRSELAAQTFKYELDRLSEGWSYTGRVQGRFTGGDHVEEELTLIPNRSGELFLPNVVVKRVVSIDTQSINIDSLSITDGPRIATDEPNELAAEQVIVSEHANTRLLIVPETNMVAITF